VLEHAFANSTRITYRAGLLLFHVFCDMKDIPEAQRAPACAVLLSSSVLTLAGTYAPKTIVNYLAGVHAWHIIHGLLWQPNAMETNALIKAAEGLRPAASRRKPHHPFTIKHIIALRSQLDLTLPLDAAVFACLMRTFYSAARLGERPLSLTISKSTPLLLTARSLPTALAKAIAPSQNLKCWLCCQKLPSHAVLTPFRVMASELAPHLNTCSEVFLSRS
jgi:hypothetical protein